MIEERYMEFLQEIYNLRYDVRAAVDYHSCMSNRCVSTNDTVGVCYHDGAVMAYESLIPRLSALLDKAEGGR